MRSRRGQCALSVAAQPIVDRRGGVDELQELNATESRRFLVRVRVDCAGRGLPRPQGSLRSALHRPRGPDYYKDLATSIEYSTTQQERPEVVTASVEPHTIFERRKDQIWDLSLQQALQLALQNNKIIRVAGSVHHAGQRINVQPEQPGHRSTIPPSRRRGVLLGGRGVEAALSDFDASWTTTFNIGQNQTIQNNAALAGGLPAGQVLDQYTGTYNSTLQKTFANGGQLSLSNVWNYVATNQPVLFPTSYTGYVQAQYTQPLWAGSGTEFTRIASPIGSGVSGISGVSQGVVIARINEDIALGCF